MTTTMRVRDYMHTDLTTVRDDTDSMRAVRLLIEHDLSGLPVVDDSGSLVGILTERDLMLTALQAGYHDESGGPVSRLMTAPVHTLHPDDSLMEVAEMFADSSIRRCPVVEDGRLVGLISRRDVLRALTQDAWFPKP